MPRYHFDIHENGVIIPDDDGHEFESCAQAKEQALATGASIAKEAFIAGSACQVVIDVREDDAPPYLNVSTSLSVEEQ